MIKNTPTIFLRASAFLLGLAVLGLCVFVMPMGIASDNTGGYRYILLGMYLPAVPFFIGLYQGFKLLNYIDKNKIFSRQAVSALKVIKYCGFIISILYALGMPYIFYTAQLDDAPGVVLIGLIFTFAPLIVGTAAAICQNLLQKIVDIKSENELTV